MMIINKRQNKLITNKNDAVFSCVFLLTRTNNKPKPNHSKKVSKAEWLTCLDLLFYPLDFKSSEFWGLVLLLVLYNKC